MKKITCIQRYVLDNLIEDEILSTNSLLGAVSKVCSEEQFNNILSILIETPIPCTDVPKLERKEDSVVLTKLKNMQIVAQENIVHYPILFYKRKQMKLLKNQNLTM